jgi:hypothetical protein
MNKKDNIKNLNIHVNIIHEKWYGKNKIDEVHCSGSLHEILDNAKEIKDSIKEKDKNIEFE